ncbi:MAG: hypothetical protein GY805_23460 [Chloroflexi bacterium]|nr:hypothetical protein [Chloroflexota bacterium]
MHGEDATLNGRFHLRLPNRLLTAAEDGDEDHRRPGAQHPHEGCTSHSDDDTVQDE